MWKQLFKTIRILHFHKRIQQFHNSINIPKKSKIIISICPISTEKIWNVFRHEDYKISHKPHKLQNKTYFGSLQSQSNKEKEMIVY